ncbi:MAG: MFS transporter [Gemmatimonadales bacterium]|nr:MAG: MFS transporter [Gemmatimonadales bacterium]
MSHAVSRAVKRLVDVRDEEVAALVWSCVYFFLVLAAYFVIRPIRDQMGIAGGVENLAWLFTGTLVGMLVLHPVFTWLVSRYPRRVFVRWIYRFFILNLVAFYALFQFADAEQSIWVARFFFIWTSVFNLFVVTVFWSFMTDVYQPSQGKRLFGFIAVGGTIGALTGSTITGTLVGWLGPVTMLLVSAALLELASWASRRLSFHEGRLGLVVEEEPEAEADLKVVREAPPEERSDQVIGGGVLEGIQHVLKSPYLLGIAAFIAFFAIVSTFLWFHLMHIVDQAYPGDDVGQTQLFSWMEIAVQSLTLVTQLFLTGRILRWLGIGLALSFLPLVSIIGFGILGAAPILMVVVLFQVFRRAGNFAIQRPAREVLYTVLPRTDKWKAKNFNDTFVYRLGDQAGAWSHHAMMVWMGLGLSAVAFAMVPVSFMWLGLALWLGKRHRDYGAAGPELDAVRKAPVVGKA